MAETDEQRSARRGRGLRDSDFHDPDSVLGDATGRVLLVHEESA